MIGIIIGIVLIIITIIYNYYFIKNHMRNNKIGETLINTRINIFSADSFLGSLLLVFSLFIFLLFAQSKAVVILLFSILFLLNGIMYLFRSYIRERFTKNGIITRDGYWPYTIVKSYELKLNYNKKSFIKKNRSTFTLKLNLTNNDYDYTLHLVFNNKELDLIKKLLKDNNIPILID